MIVAGAVGSGLVGNVDGVDAADELGDEVGMAEVGVDVPVTAGAGFRLLGELPSESGDDCWLTGVRDGAGVSEVEARGKDLVVGVP